jgi:hypothetical protein
LLVYFFSVTSPASLSTASLPHIPEFPGTQNIPTEWWWKCHSTPFGTELPKGRCSSSLKGFQNRLTVRANTEVFLWPNIYMNFICRSQDSISSLRDTELYSRRLLIDTGTVPPLPPRPGPITTPDEPLNCGESPRCYGTLLFILEHT